jgi:hypothetical protein
VIVTIALLNSFWVMAVQPSMVLVGSKCRAGHEKNPESLHFEC